MAGLVVKNACSLLLPLWIHKGPHRGLVAALRYFGSPGFSASSLRQRSNDMAGVITKAPRFGIPPAGPKLEPTVPNGTGPAGARGPGAVAPPIYRKAKKQ